MLPIAFESTTTPEDAMPATLNKVTLIGNLGKNPESRSFEGGGKVVTFTLATTAHWTDRESGDKREKTQWHNIAIFNDALGEVAMRNLKKGSSVYVEGQLETRSWEKNGETRYMTEVVLRARNSDLQMLSKAPDRPNETARASRSIGPSGRR
jgi:single-strand DNA-binding protein